MLMEPAVLDVRGLRMRYGDLDVLRDVGFTALRGEVVTLLGPNGAGKTTTTEILEGFRMRSAGEVSVLGVDPAKGDEQWRARIGVVLQSWRDHGRWKVRELLHHLGHYYAPYSGPNRARPHDPDELIELVGLGERADRRINSLSGGERRRLDVAIGIVGRPEVLFLDEPTAGFDPQVRRDFHDVVHRLSDLEDTTILLTTHDLDDGRTLITILNTVLGLALLVVPAFFLVNGLTDAGLGGWLTLLGVLLLGLLAALPWGIIVGSLVRTPSSGFGLTTLPIGALTAISGIFYPISAMPGWVQGVAQAFPVYWLGLGMRRPAARRGGRGRDRRLVAAPRNARRTQRMGGRGAPARALRTAPDGPARVRLHHGGAAPSSPPTGQVRG